MSATTSGVDVGIIDHHVALGYDMVWFIKRGDMHPNSEEKQMTEIKVASVSDVDEGEAIVIARDVTGAEDDIALFHAEDGEWYALNDTCTHQEASLADGWIEDAEVECPLHSAKFCLRTGAALCMPATVAAKTYPVTVRGDEVYLDPTASNTDTAKD